MAEALWRIAAERGLRAASMREIAAEAGVSLRAVQYRFPSKHQLLVAALQLLHEDNERRVAARLAGSDAAAAPRDLLRAILAEFLPLDESRRMVLRVYEAYYARSLTDPALAAVFLRDSHPVEGLVAEIIAKAQRAGMAPPGLDPRHEADLLVSGVTGLGVEVLHGRCGVAEVWRVIDYHLDRIFNGANGELTASANSVSFRANNISQA
ncbi:TetR/AcrR family transcriptional regulator [Sphaerisporangium sp. NPDC005288]|uniref:TetR/AcrR family transcriptional regulator n=1 Tax=Sphaerisporangium sp. NPDC005288 TaxID=3155114 RepID=UPI0033AB5F3F